MCVVCGSVTSFFLVVGMRLKAPISRSHSVRSSCLGDDHQRGRVVDALHERFDVVLQQEIDALNGAAVLIQRRLGLLQRLERVVGLRERPGPQISVGLGSGVGDVQPLPGLVVAQCPVVQDLLPQLAIADGAVHPAHVLVAVDHRDLADETPDPRVDRPEDESVPA